MKIHLFKKRPDRHKYDWVLPYLQSHITLTPNPFLWNRIRAHLTSLPTPDYATAGLPFTRVWGWRWAFPFIFIMTITLGVYIGFKFANNYKNYNQPEGIYHLESITPEAEILSSDDIDNL